MDCVIKNKGFTLIELLAVMVILVIILSITIPSISIMIEKTNVSAFESNAKLVLKAADYKKLENEQFDITLINEDNLNSVLGLVEENYSSLNISTSSNKTYVNIVGDGKWDGLIACGTYEKIMIVKEQSDCSKDSVPPTITLLGESTVSLIVGDDYSELWAIAVDNINGDITDKIVISGTVDITKPGSYIVTYTVYDNDNNKASAIRTINIIRPSYMFEYTGNYETLSIPTDGNYQIELWGAAGGGTSDEVRGVSLGGSGAYTKGLINLKEDQKIYIYICRTKWQYF